MLLAPLKEYFTEVRKLSLIVLLVPGVGAQGGSLLMYANTEWMWSIRLVD
jgi:hypothetical protein